MLSKDKILALIEPLLTGKKFFLLSLDISHSNSIRLVIDSMEGATIDDCVAFSRAIEHQLDREIEDFDIEVSSAGLTEPFRIKEQYLKNIGNEIELILKTGQKHTGILLSSGDTGFDIETEKKVRIEGKKKKQTVREKQSFSFDECSKVRNLLKFK